MLILLVGNKRTGKDTSAAIIQELTGYQRIALADPIKEIVSQITGLTREELEELKEDDKFKLNGKTIRQILQDVGQGMKKLFNSEYIWTSIAYRKIKNSDAIISDVRLQSEIDFFEEALHGQVITIKLIRDVSKNDQHITEQADKLKTKYTVENNGTIDELKIKLSRILIQETIPIQFGLFDKRS